MARGIAVALAGTFGLALLAGSVAAQPPERSKELIKLRVPVKLKSMLATRTRLVCWIRDAKGSALQIGSGAYEKFSDFYDITNGEFDQVIEMIMTPKSGTSFALAATYDCRLELQPAGNTFGQGTPSGDPNSPVNARLAKPDQFFRSQVVGRLVPRRMAVPENDDRGDVRGGNDLTTGPKEREH